MYYVFKRKSIVLNRYNICCEHDQYLMEPALSDDSFTYSDYENSNCVCISKLSAWPTSSMEMVELAARISWLANRPPFSISVAPTTDSDEVPT